MIDGALSDVEVSKRMAHALRHEPALYGLDLDDDGSVELTELVDALRRRGGPWAALDVVDVVRVVETGTKPRYEIVGTRIRARYGHSVETRHTLPTATPPPVLLHGTSPEACVAIRKIGLLPMRRQFVHLSTDRETAEDVGRRKSPTPVILTIDAVGADPAEVTFHRAHDGLWLASAIPPSLITGWPDGQPEAR